MSEKSLATKIITGGSVVIAVVAILSAWGTYGWITRAAYAQDHEGASVEVQQTAILKLLESQKIALDLLQKGQDRNQDQWECDETDEELEELIEKESINGLSTKEKRDKVKAEEVWVAKDCTRFTD